MSNDSSLVLMAGGALVLVIIGLGVLGGRIGRYRRVVRDLEATTPEERAQAGVALAGFGARWATKPLAAAMAQESDGRVRLAVALAVLRWSGGPGRELQRWAQHEVETRHREVAPVLTSVALPAPMAPPAPVAAPAVIDDVPVIRWGARPNYT